MTLEQQANPIGIPDRRRILEKAGIRQPAGQALLAIAQRQTSASDQAMAVSPTLNSLVASP